MKVLVLANQKGGVGKSAIACQLAYFLAGLRNQRVLFLDLDHQGNASSALIQFDLVTVEGEGSAVFGGALGLNAKSSLVLVRADRELIRLERQAERHNAFATALRTFIARHRDQFDICLIDTNPNPDIRLIAALVVADYVLSPIQLNQEAIDGIGALTRDIARVKAKLNPKVELIGVIPNLVEATPFQRANLQQLIAQCGSLLLKKGDGGFAFIPTRTAIAEAQAGGRPVWQLGKTSARTAWSEMRPVFEAVAHRMGVA